VTRTSATYDGLDMTRARPPTLIIASSSLGPDDDSVDLDDDTVDTVRADLLTPKAVVLPFALDFTVPAGAGDALGPELHVVLVLQPELTIDGTAAL
jgi:hypothetical protein